jgi:hypothetical protein
MDWWLAKDATHTSSILWVREAPTTYDVDMAIAPEDPKSK